MSWKQLTGMIQEAADIDAKDESGVPTSCATCCTPLTAGEDGKLVCPWDGLVWPDDAPAWGRFPGSY